MAAFVISGVEPSGSTISLLVNLLIKLSLCLTKHHSMKT
jgi:hypothetical protein